MDKHDKVLSQSITDVFGGRNRDRGSSRDCAIQDIGSAPWSPKFGLCFLDFLESRGLPYSSWGSNCSCSLLCHFADGDRRAARCYEISCSCGDSFDAQGCRAADISDSGQLQGARVRVGN